MVTGSGRTQKPTADMGTGEKAKKTRNRIPQSCQACRKRKLKCDRQHPACENCIKRGDEEACVYVEPPEDEKTRALRSRLEFLEAQVREITASIAAAESPDKSTTSEEGPDLSLLESFSKLRLRAKDDKAIYYGPNSRYGIISEYPEAFKLLQFKKRKEMCDLMQTRWSLLKDDVIPTGFPFNVMLLEDALPAMLPDRPICDQLIYRYFEASNPLFTIIDMPHFMELYDRLWTQGTKIPMQMLSCTFFMLAIAAHSLNDGHPLLGFLSAEGQAGALKLARRWKIYGEMALGQIDPLRKTTITNIKAILLLCLLEDADQVRWNMIGLVVNMARMTGLYRNPDVFEELDDRTRAQRRRLWSYIYILDQIESLHYGHPKTIGEGTFDCFPVEPSASAPDPDDLYLYWMFKLHQAFAASFPGPIGIQKSLPCVQAADQRVRALLSQLPPELTLPDNYVPAATETPLQIVRRYTIACLSQGFFVTLHRPYASISEVSRSTIVSISWTLASYHSQLIALGGVLDSFRWYVEEFLDPQFFRGIAVLGSLVAKTPTLPDAPIILSHVQLAGEQARLKALRKRDHAKVHGVFRAILFELAEKNVFPDTPEVPYSSSEPSAEGTPEELGWGMEDILMESAFKWDEYLLDMVLDPSQVNNMG